MAPEVMEHTEGYDEKADVRLCTLSRGGCPSET
jgi:hypothetical protein